MLRSMFARNLASRLTATPAIKSQARSIYFYMNKVMLIGSVGNDPRVIDFADGKKMVMFPLATSRRYKDGEGNLLEQTAWHKIRLTNENALRAEKLIRKGALVQVEGSIRYDTFTNKEGVDVNTTSIKGDSFKIVLFPKRKEGEEGEQGERNEEESS
ncbi:hypothetical protein GGF46_000146 [Coemansia sp. RSA 552]|nr:hypothetical protein GGF46_000146 [Coemansia sp. RSA 552]